MDPLIRKFYVKAFEIRLTNNLFVLYVDFIIITTLFYLVIVGF